MNIFFTILQDDRLNSGEWGNSSSSGEPALSLQIYSHLNLDLLSDFKKTHTNRYNVKHREEKVQIFWRRFIFFS